jgi:hypothetical protein
MWQKKRSCCYLAAVAATAETIECTIFVPLDLLCSEVDRGFVLLMVSLLLLMLLMVMMCLCCT